MPITKKQGNVKVIILQKTLYAGPRIEIDVFYQLRSGRIEIDVIALFFHHLGLGTSIRGFLLLEKERRTKMVSNEQMGNCF